MLASHLNSVRLGAAGCEDDISIPSNNDSFSGIDAPNTSSGFNTSEAESQTRDLAR